MVRQILNAPLYCPPVLLSMDHFWLFATTKITQGWIYTKHYTLLMVQKTLLFQPGINPKIDKCNQNISIKLNRKCNCSDQYDVIMLLILTKIQNMSKETHQLADFF